MQTNSFTDQISNVKSKINGFQAQNVTDFINATVIAPILNLGLSGLKFSIRKTETINVSSDITDHYLESNTPVQQHISNKPLKITLTGEIHELTITNLSNSSTGVLQNLTEKLVAIAALAPLISSTTKNIMKAIDIGSVGNTTAGDIISNSIQAGTDLYSLYKNLLSLSTNQGKITQFILGLWKGKIGLGVDTRLGYYTSMYIENVRITAREGTTQVADIEVSLKQLRFASTQKVPFDNTAYQARLDQQKQDENDLGKGTSPPTSQEDKDSIVYSYKGKIV